MEIDSIESPEEILVTVDVIVDASNVHDASLAVDDVIQSLVSQDENALPAPSQWTWDRTVIVGSPLY